MTGRWAGLFISIVLCVFAAAAARAADCPPLQIVASVPMSYDPAGRPYIPVTLGSAQKSMLVDTGGALSEVTQATATELKLPQVRVPIVQYGISGQTSDRAATVPQFAIGNLSASNIQLMIEPDSSAFGHDFAGVIGPTILRFYDADFDFGANKFNLMSQDHCAGKVIYWPAGTVAALPMKVARMVGHVLVPVTLDGVKLNALIDTGATTSFVSARIVGSDFNLKLGAPDTPDVGPLYGSDNARVYSHTFHSLALEGISISNPVLDIIPDLNRDKYTAPAQTGSRLSTADESGGLEDVTIGADILKQLHVYIAYKEKMLYVTPATPAPSVATTAPGAAAAGASASSTSK